MGIFVHDKQSLVFPQVQVFQLAYIGVVNVLGILYQASGVFDQNNKLYAIVGGQYDFVPDPVMVGSSYIHAQLLDIFFGVNADVICAQKIHLFYRYVTFSLTVYNVLYLPVSQNIISDRKGISVIGMLNRLPIPVFEFVLTFLLSSVLKDHLISSISGVF